MVSSHAAGCSRNWRQDFDARVPCLGESLVRGSAGRCPARSRVSGAPASDCAGRLFGREAGRHLEDAMERIRWLGIQLRAGKDSGSLWLPSRKAVRAAKPRRTVLQNQFQVETYSAAKCLMSKWRAFLNTVRTERFEQVLSLRSLLPGTTRAA